MPYKNYNLKYVRILLMLPNDSPNIASNDRKKLAVSVLTKALRGKDFQIQLLQPFLSV